MVRLSTLEAKVSPAAVKLATHVHFWYLHDYVPPLPPHKYFCMNSFVLFRSSASTLFPFPSIVSAMHTAL